MSFSLYRLQAGMLPPVAVAPGASGTESSHVVVFFAESPLPAGAQQISPSP
ncbi:hypothetical protein HQN64_01060 [Enterobacteriaceae bacterium BIT-l23]|uniref:hypothetical protein n=1 Tax=Jejubacter TaxID=2815296 RepID=UPI00143D6A56|nr:hypothetical protein [Jejubacter calystegiae]NUU64701.1 hypothetical protein [Enterobacteriaceae bacterium BIT-l23]